MTDKLKRQIQKASKKSGIYIFKDKGGGFLYIGKAWNLKSRLKQYLHPVKSSKAGVAKQEFNRVNKKTYSPFLEHFLKETEKVETQVTNSEIEALILESKLIKEKQPKYNIMLRDDKQYFYVGFSNESFPKILITHQPTKIQKSKNRMQNDNSKFKNLQNEFIGPFTDGSALKTTLRLLRRIFLYCTCKQPHHNFCLNYHIGKCPGFCCLKEPTTNNRQLTTYNRNIKAIKDILSVKKESLIEKLKKELSQLSKNQEFEKAIELRNKIEKLKQIFENAKILHDTNLRITSESTNTKTLSEIKNIFCLPKVPVRIEGYDISNIQGKNAVGAMIVFTHSTSSGQAGYQPDKNEYRKFKIIFPEAEPWVRYGAGEKTPNDIAMLKEVLVRRFNHPEWPYPDLIFIDGGKGQLNAADGIISNFQFLNSTAIPQRIASDSAEPSTSKQIQNSKFKIPIISLAKGKQEIFSSTFRKPVPLKKLPARVQNLILQIDSEAHRFAIAFYRKLHRKKLIEKFTP